MASDNKVSSFFLLILIGLAIYYLFNCEGFNSFSKLTNNIKENFTTASASEPEEEFVEEEVIEEDLSQSMTQSYVTPSSMIPLSVMEQQQMDVPEIKYEVSQEPYVPQSVINDIVAGDQSQQIDNNSQPVVQNNIYNFQPNDESELGLSGSSLNDAFNLPVPNEAQTDEIDFKKQNVDNYNARDFLPREVNDEWFETDFSLAKYQLNDDKLINTEKYIIGINTVGQSLKNASWDIRGTIPNPKLVVSPWNNSTYEPDFNLKPLC
jgi:hypothetical protein